jgi:hypothetical protein
MSEKSVLDIDINTLLIRHVGKTSPEQAVQCAGATKVLSFQQFSDQILTQNSFYIIKLAGM